MLRQVSCESILLHWFSFLFVASFFLLLEAQRARAHRVHHLIVPWGKTAWKRVACEHNPPQIISQ